MSGYSVNERKLGKERKPMTSTCGDCGEPVVKGKLLCEECLAQFVEYGPILSETRRER